VVRVFDTGFIGLKVVKYNQLTFQKPEINKMSLYRWKHRFTDGYNRLKKGHAYLYDLYAVEQILKKEEVII